MTVGVAVNNATTSAATHLVRLLRSAPAVSVQECIAVLVLALKDRDLAQTTPPPRDVWPSAYFAARFSAAGGFGNNLMTLP